MPSPPFSAPHAALCSARTMNALRKAEHFQQSSVTPLVPTVSVGSDAAAIGQKRPRCASDFDVRQERPPPPRKDLRIENGSAPPVCTAAPKKRRAVLPKIGTTARYLAPHQPAVATRTQERKAFAKDTVADAIADPFRGAEASVSATNTSPVQRKSLPKTGSSRQLPRSFPDCEITPAPPGHVAPPSFVQGFRTVAAPSLELHATPKKRRNLPKIGSLQRTPPAISNSSQQINRISPKPASVVEDHFSVNDRGATNVDVDQEKKTSKATPICRTLAYSQDEIEEEEVVEAGAKPEAAAEPSVEGNGQEEFLTRTAAIHRMTMGCFGFMGEIVGREREKQRITQFLESNASGQALVVTGSPGSGKTLVVEEMVRRHTDNSEDALTFSISAFQFETIENMYTAIRSRIYERTNVWRLPRWKKCVMLKYLSERKYRTKLLRPM